MPAHAKGLLPKFPSRTVSGETLSLTCRSTYRCADSFFRDVGWWNPRSQCNDITHVLQLAVLRRNFIAKLGNELVNARGKVLVVGCRCLLPSNDSAFSSMNPPMNWKAVEMSGVGEAEVVGSGQPCPSPMFHDSLCVVCPAPRELHTPPIRHPSQPTSPMSR